MSIPVTTPIENIVDLGTWTAAYMTVINSLGRPRNLVNIHKARLGKQTTTLQVAEHRMMVWVRPTYTVFVNNDKGVCFEVPEGATEDAAWTAWWDYRKAMREPE